MPGNGRTRDRKTFGDFSSGKVALRQELDDFLSDWIRECFEFIHDPYVTLLLRTVKKRNASYRRSFSAPIWIRRREATLFESPCISHR